MIYPLNFETGHIITIMYGGILQLFEFWLYLIWNCWFIHCFHMDTRCDYEAIRKVCNYIDVVFLLYGSTWAQINLWFYCDPSAKSTLQKFYIQVTACHCISPSIFPSLCIVEVILCFYSLNIFQIQLLVFFTY